MSAARKDWRGIGSWCLYDWANSAFNTIIGTFVFSVYFAGAVYGDATAGSELWGWLLGAAGLAVAVISPIAGAIADKMGRQKPWLGALTLGTVVFTAPLWFIQPDPSFVPLALLLVFLATLPFEFAIVFYNAMLPHTAPKGMIGRVSGWGWGLGYFGGVASLGLCLVLLVLPEQPLFGLSNDPEEMEHIRATGPLVALWYALFALPLFLFTADQPSTGMPLGKAVGAGLRELVNTLKAVRRYGNIVRFLIASALYRDGFATLFAMGGLYAAGTFGMDNTQLIIFAIGLNITAGLGSLGFAFVDDRIGSKPTILISLAGVVIAGTGTLLVVDWTTFLALALVLGIFVGPAQAAGRSLMARIMPDGMETEMYGLYSFAGKSTAFVGPWLFASVVALTDSQRWGMSTVVFLMIAGALVLLTVREVKAAKVPG